MSVHLPTPIFAFRPRRKSIFDSESAPSLVVRASAAFSVAPSRLLNALTIPEYIEAWLTPPDVDEVRCSGNPVAGEALSVELRCNGRAANSVFADYKEVSKQELD